MGKKRISVCGVFCQDECHAFGDECAGCNQLKGKVDWVKYIGKTVCPIYDCVITKRIRHCGECPELPCEIMLVETRNPDRNETEYFADIQTRIGNLKKLCSKDQN
jgi:hypothetical protein